MAKKGKLIVIEGSDGSGKTTQANHLLAYLKSHKIPSAYISFPRYEKSHWGKMVRRYLNGDFGKINEVDPYFASMLYAGDRLLASSEINKWLDEGRVVVCNRYVGSNIGHMGAKFKSQSEKSKYIEWLENLEYGENKVPREDIVVLLQVEPEVSRKLMNERKLDIHEKDLQYQEEVGKVYDYVAGVKKNWVKVKCTRDGNILKPEEVNDLVLKILKEKRII